MPCESDAKSTNLVQSIGEFLNGLLGVSLGFGGPGYYGGYGYYGYAPVYAAPVYAAPVYTTAAYARPVYTTAVYARTPAYVLARMAAGNVLRKLAKRTEGIKIDGKTLAIAVAA